jgi:hypothetical protein
MGSKFCYIILLHPSSTRENKKIISKNLATLAARAILSVRFSKFLIKNSYSWTK